MDICGFESHHPHQFMYAKMRINLEYPFSSLYKRGYIRTSRKDRRKRVDLVNGDGLSDYKISPIVNLTKSKIHRYRKEQGITLKFIIIKEEIIMVLFAKVTSPEAGYKSDSDKLKDLVFDKFYEVGYIDMGGSYTSVYLEGFKGEFNSVNFTFYKKCDGLYEEHDIFSDPNYNPYL